MAPAKAKNAYTYEAAMMANAEAMRAAKLARAKAEEAEELALKAMSEAEEAAKAIAHEATEEELFAAVFRRYWNRLYARRGIRTFHQSTSIPAMCYTPEHDVPTKSTDTLLVVSVKVASIDEYCLRWPLPVFGVIAARDVLDHKRNIIFHHPRSNCQTITQEDPYLELTGPSRAIVVMSEDPLYIEVKLKVKGAMKCEDKDLSNLVVRYKTGCHLGSIYPGRLSTLEFRFSHIAHSVEATVSIRVIGGFWPDGFRGVFAAESGDDGLRVKLLDFGDGGLPVDADGVIKLSRSVVSTEFGKLLKVSAMACPINNERHVESDHVVLGTQWNGRSSIELNVGSCSMDVTVGWSLFHQE